MSKKAWIVIIAVTAAVTVFSFGSMMAVRPDSSIGEYADSVFEEAKKRQETPLVSTSAPLKTDVEAMSDEDIMSEKVSAILSSDDEFISSLSDKVASRIENNLSSWFEDHKNEVVSTAEAARDEYLSNAEKIIEEKEIDTREYTDGKISEERSNIDSEIAKLRAEMKAGLNAHSKAIEEGKAQSTVYVDSAKEEINAYIDSAIDSVRAYADSLMKQVEEYVNQKIAEIPDSEAFKAVTIPSFDMHRDMKLLDGTVSVDAHPGYATLRFPSSITPSNIEYGLGVFKDRYPEVSDYITFTNGGRALLATYPATIPESDVSYGLDIIEKLLASFIPLPKPEPTDTDFTINRSIPFANSTIEVVANKDKATFAFPSDISDDDIESMVNMLLFSYPDETASFVFAVDDGIATIAYDKEYTEDEVNTSIDALIAFYSSPIIHINRDIAIYNSSIKIDAYRSKAIISIPQVISNSEIENAISIIKASYPEETKDFIFNINGNEVSVEYPAVSSSEELNTYIDALQSLIKKLIGVPTPPVFNIERRLSGTPAAPRIFATNPVFPEPNENIAEENIPNVRNSVRNIEVQRYMELLK